MSCHDIGRGLNSVVKVVIGLYEQGQLSKEAAMPILCACRRGVNWCDGNEDEAMQALVDAGYCGLCLEKPDSVTNVYDNGLGYPEKYEVFDRYDKCAAHFFVCPRCKQRLIEEYKAGSK